MFSKKARLSFTFHVYMKKSKKNQKRKVTAILIAMKTTQRLQFPSPKLVCVLKSTSLLLYCWGKHFEKFKENKQKWVTTSSTLELVGDSMNIWSLQYLYLQKLPRWPFVQDYFDCFPIQVLDKQEILQVFHLKTR